MRRLIDYMMSRGLTKSEAFYVVDQCKALGGRAYSRPYGRPAWRRTYDAEVTDQGYSSYTERDRDRY